MIVQDRDYKIVLPKLHPKQESFVSDQVKRKMVKAGRRSGKTVGAADLAVEQFAKEKRRVLYAAPTLEQIQRFWTTVTRALSEPTRHKVYRKNETEHFIEVAGTEQRIKAKTAWNADSLRGDYADLLILDEWQLMDEDAWDYVGAPMLLDNNGDAVFIYTPPSLHSRSVSKAKDPQHAAKLYAKAQADTSGRWKTYHFTSHDNPYISAAALEEITKDMTALSYKMEILAQDINQAPGALWQRADIDKYRVLKVPDDQDRVVVGVDPSATSEGDEAGIIVGALADGEGYCLADESLQGSPLKWATTAVIAYHKFHADRVVAEANQGGEMVEQVIHQVDPNVPVTLVHASRGKATRAEPVAAKTEQGRIHHVGQFPHLEDELCLWVPGDASPNRLDAYVWTFTELLLGAEPGLFVAGAPAQPRRRIVTIAGLPADGLVSFYKGQ